MRPVTSALPKVAMPLLLLLPFLVYLGTGTIGVRGQSLIAASPCYGICIQEVTNCTAPDSLRMCCAELQQCFWRCVHPTYRRLVVLPRCYAYDNTMLLALYN